MKRVILLFLMAFVAFSGLSFATVTRVKTMGNVNNFVYDDANIFSWPSTVAGVSDRFLLELGEDAIANATYDDAVGPGFPNGFGGGALFGINEFNHLGFYVNGNDRSNGGGVADDFFPAELSLDDFVTLFYAYGSENVDFGASFNLGKSRNEQTVPEAAQSKESLGRMGIQGGITYWMEDDNSLDLAFEYTKTSITDEEWDAGESAVVTTAEDDGYASISARFRMFYNYTDDVQLVPFFEFSKDDRGVNWDTAADADTDHETDKTETTTIDAALGINHFPTEQLQLVVVGGIRLISTDVTVQGEKTEENSDSHIPYIKGGIDAELRDWLNIRGGVEKQLWSDEHKGLAEGADLTQHSGADFQGYIGAGIHLGDWTIDTQVDPNIFYRGPNFISGAAANLNTRVSLVRPW